MLALALASCIVVDDFGNYWDKGFIDNCVNEIVQNGMNENNRMQPSSSDTTAMRSLRLGNHTFLMVREHSEDKGGNLIRYEIRGGEYVSYRLNENKRGDFLHYYPDSSVVITTETATIPVLNADSAALLATIANEEAYWVESSREPYNPSHRTDCIHTLY